MSRLEAGQDKNAQEPTNVKKTARTSMSSKKKNILIIVAFVVLFTLLLGGGIILSSSPGEEQGLTEQRGIAINVKDFGATGNGTTDDTASIIKALKRVPTEGARVHFPSGAYLITSMIDIPHNVVMTGSSATIKGIKDKVMFQIGNNNTFSNLTFYNCNMALFSNSRTNTVVDSCRFINIHTAAINFYGSRNSEVKNSSFYDIVKNSIVIDKDAHNINIHDSVFNNPAIYGGYSTEQISGHIYVFNGDRISVINNTVKNNGGQGIIFSYNSGTGKGTTNSIAKGNTCEGNGQEGITSFGGSQKLSKNNSIIDNISKNNRFHQIECWQSDNCIIQGNTVDEFSTRGNVSAIMVFSSNDVNVVSNTVVRARSNGIAVTMGSKNCTISGNTVNNTNMAAYTEDHMGQGILLDTLGGGMPSYISIKDNRVASVNKSRTIDIKKSGVYSTYITNQRNTITNNSVEGYAYTVHPYAIRTCDTYIEAE